MSRGPTKTTKPVAAVYCRISLNRDGEKTGTDRQESDCRALCKREGLTVGHVYVDDDKSAYNGKSRPAFDAMLKELDRYDALVYWKTDRLVRRTVQFWKVVEACEQANVRLVSVVDPIDTSTPLGKGVAGMLASVGEQESHNTGIRVARRDEENAANGRAHGHRRAFGYDQRRDANDRVIPGSPIFVVKGEAKAIREARDRILHGEAMRSICLDWNRRGIKPVTAPAWRVSTFKRMVTNPMIAGQRTFRGDVVGEGVWPPIISVEDRERILAVLGDPKVRTRGRPAAYLLTGIVVCGRCHKVLRSGVRGNGQRKWACVRTPGDESHCGQLSVVADHVDRLVEDALLHRLDSPELAKALRKRQTSKKSAGKGASITELERRITQLGSDYDEGLVSRREWLDRRGPLLERLDAARAALVPATNGVEVLGQFAGVDIPKRWAEVPLDVRRAVAAALIEAVVVAPASGRGNTFDPSRISITWRA